jgi:hypothetical protein
VYLYRPRRGQSIELSRIAGITWEVVGRAFFLGLILNVTASETGAAMPAFVEPSVDGLRPASTDEAVNHHHSKRRWQVDPRRMLAANDQAVDQTVGPPRPNQDARRAQERPLEEPKPASPASPVGVAPQNKPEVLPSWMARTFDLPGAGVLTPKGTLIVEPYLQYAHLSSNRVTLTGFTVVPALTIGLINVRGITRDLYTAAFVGRYGVTNRLELEVRVPFLYRQDSITGRPLATPSQDDTMSTTEGWGLADIEGTARFQLNQGGPDKPYFVAFTRFKSITGRGPFEVPTDPLTELQTELPTGSGFYVIQPGLTLLFPSDPVVIFSSVSFIYNMPRDFTIDGETGRINPGSGGNANVGLGVSLNEKLSLTLGYDHTVFSKPTAASNLLLATAPQTTHIGVLLIGGSYRLSESSFMNFVVGIGATREAPDLQVTLRIPTALPVKKWFSRLTSSEGSATQ